MQNKEIDNSLSEKKFDDWCKNIFDKVYISDQTICYSFEKEDFYFVDSQERTVVKLSDPKLVNFANHVYAHQLQQKQIDWLLNFEKSGYYYFSNLENLDKWNKKIEKIYDKYYDKVSDDVLKQKLFEAAKKIENEKRNMEERS